MSFMVVINGPVARAGSILNRLSNRGMKVPKTEAKIITENKAELTDSVSARDSF